MTDPLLWGRVVVESSFFSLHFDDLQNTSENACMPHDNLTCLPIVLLYCIVPVLSVNLASTPTHRPQKKNNVACGDSGKIESFRL